ncbi:MAG: family 2 glycosyl transferase [Candidatus Nitrosotenuis sp.]|nr:family 2 glycosyl transferase [Candidatus Nitrosotenuis sp.]
MMLIFITLQHLQSALAIRIEKEDPKLIAYSTFFVIGYKQIIDVLLMKAAIETLLKRKTVWTSAKRIGTEQK